MKVLQQINPVRHGQDLSFKEPQQPTITDYSRYLIGTEADEELFCFKSNILFLEVICKFLESFKGMCAFPEGFSNHTMRAFVKSILLQSKISYSIVATGLLYLLWGKQSMKLKHHKISRQIGIFEIFVASLMLATKYLNDRNASNSAWSRISGISLDTLNKMEMRLLSFIEYKLHIEVELFDKWIKFLFQPTKLSTYLKCTDSTNSIDSVSLNSYKKIKMC